MPDRVLDEGLKDQARNERAPGRVADVDRDAQAFTVAEALDGEIRLDELELSIQRQLLDVGGFKRAAQQLGELGQHQLGTVRIIPHQPRYGIQGVEQEMRVQLHLEGLDLGTSELHFELRGAKLPGTRHTVVPCNVDRGNDPPVGQQREVDLQKGEWARPAVSDDQRCQHRLEKQLHSAERDPGRQVDRERHAPTCG